MENAKELKGKANVPVFKKSLAIQLMKEGHKCIDEVANYKKEGYTVFYFEATEEVKESIRKISMEQGRKIFKLKNRRVANELIELGYELLNIRHTNTEGRQFIFKWDETIHETMVEVRTKIFGD